MLECLFSYGGGGFQLGPDLPADNPEGKGGLVVQVDAYALEDLELVSRVLICAIPRRFYKTNAQLFNYLLFFAPT